MTVNDIKHARIQAWIEECVKMCEPDNVVVCDGSTAEYDRLMKKCVDAGLATPLAKKPNSFLFRSLPSDVARVESRTFISSVKEEDAGPTNHWIDPKELKATMKGLYKGCMHGRTMYVIPFCMGPLGSPIAKYGVELTDSEYVVLNMDIMTRAGEKVWEYFGTDGDFVPCLHSVGHDSHNLIVIGTNDEDMLAAVEELQRIGGGICIAEDGQIRGALPLPVGGLMTNEPALMVAKQQAEMIALAREMGVPEFYSPFLTLAFLSLPVIPSLKLTDRGLVDVDSFKFIPLEVK